MEGSVASVYKHDTRYQHSSRLLTGNLPATSPASRRDWISGLNWRDVGLLLILLALTGGIRAWQIRHTEVAARDSIGFIRMALQFERQPVAEVVRNSQQHPGYPLALLAVSWPVRQVMGGITPASMQLSAQLTSALASILLVVPMFFIGRELFNRQAGFWGTALFQCLPVPSRVFADALSEATFLLFLTAALWLAVRALRSNSPIRFAWCGLFGGLAYLTRPEGALVVIAAGLVLLGTQAHPLWRRSWKSTLTCGSSLAATALVVGSPYVLLTGQFTNKPSGQIVLETAWLPKEQNGTEPQVGVPPLGGGPRPKAELQTASAFLFGIYAPESLKDRRWWGIKAIASEVAHGYQYLAVLPVVLGLWWFRDHLRSVPGTWVIVVLCFLHGLVLWRLARVVGYVSDRHVLVLVLCGVFTGAAAVATFGTWLAGQLASRLGAPMLAKHAGWLSFLLLLALTCFGLPESLRTLHANRAGHRAAGLWLAEHTRPADLIHDPYCWAHYYAGRVFQEGTEPDAPEAYLPTHYVVLEHSGQDHSRLPTIDSSQKLAALGKVVYHWPEDKPEPSAKILIYAVSPSPPKK
jgi:hypothetical protein